MGKTNFDRMLDRYLKGELTDTERIKLEAWLDLMKTDTVKERELSRADEEKLFQRITNNVGSVEDVTGYRPPYHNKRSFLSKAWLQIAASLLFVVGLGFTSWYFVNTKRPAEIADSQSQHEKLILNDGTIVWMKKGSKLSYYEKENGRFASFSGEALFEVVKKPASPFTISCGASTVNVMGTSFNLVSNNSTLELKVLTGKVNVIPAENGANIIALPNEKVIYNGSVMQKAKMTEEDIGSIPYLNQYKMEFDNVPMQEIAKRLSSKFDTKIMIANDKINACRITADLTDHSLEATLDMMTELLDVTYTIEESTVTIKGKGCE